MYKTSFTNASFASHIHNKTSYTATETNLYNR